MKTFVDGVLSPAGLFLVAAVSAGVAALVFAGSYKHDRVGLHGLMIGLFLFASTALVCAVVSHLRAKDRGGG